MVILASDTVSKLTSPVILFIMINSILGSSLFYLPSLAVSSSGPAALIAWIVLFILAIVVTMYMAELITLHPTSGGTYQFCKKAYGRFGSFMAGWIIWIAGNMGMALALIAAAQYFIPGQTQSTFYTQIIFVILWIVVLNFMAYRGIDAGSTMLVGFGIISALTVVLMTLPSFIDVPALFSGTLRTSFNTSLLDPFFHQEGINIFRYLGLTLLFISEAFFGFEVISYMGNEIKNIQKLPKVLFLGMGLSGLIMSLYFFSSLGTVPYETYVSSIRPFANQAFNTMGSIGQNIVVFGMYLVIVGTAAAWPITSSRLIHALSKDRLFIEYFSHLHPKHNSPYRAVIFQTFIVGLFTWILFRGYGVGWNDPYKTVYLVYVVLSLIAMSLILMAVPRLRKKEAHLPRLFKAPLPRLGPTIFVSIALLLILNWISIEGSYARGILLLVGILLIVAIPLYFMVEMFYNKKALLSVNKFLSHFAVIGETLTFPFSMRKIILEHIQNLSNKKILEYGCSVGMLTKKIAHLTDTIYATDHAMHKVQICQQRTEHLVNVKVYHHPHFHDWLLQLPEKVDGIISVGALSYMQKPAQLLSALGKNIKSGGEIIFIDYDKFLHLIPNIKWVQNDQHLTAIFKQAGFSVEIEHKFGFLWNHVIVKGLKD